MSPLPAQDPARDVQTQLPPQTRRRLHLHAVVFSGKHAFRQSAFRNRIGTRMIAQQNGLTIFIRDKLGLIARAVRRRQRYALDPLAEGISNRDRHRAPYAWLRTTISLSVTGISVCASKINPSGALSCLR